MGDSHLASVTYQLCDIGMLFKFSAPVHLLLTQSVAHIPAALASLGASWKCRHSGPLPQITDCILQFNKVLR